MLQWLVRAANLNRLLQLLSQAVDYRFDEWDEDAIQLGLETTGGADGRWYDYELYGQETISLRLSRGAGDCVVVEASAPAAVESALSPIIETSDEEIVAQVYRAFASAPRPEHPVRNPQHCPECEEHDALMRARRWDTLTHHDVRYTWSPVVFLSPAGFRYWLPAFVRLSLTPDEYDFLDQLLSFLSERDSERFQQLNPEERAAIRRFLQHLAWWRPELVDERRMFAGVARSWAAGGE